MEEHGGFTEQLTSGDKSVRGRMCYPLTQPIWWVTLPLRWVLSWFIGLVLGDNAKKTAYYKLLTPANFLSGFRIWLLGYAIMMFFDGYSLTRQTEILLLAIVTDFFDGPLARNNNEVTELGTYMDHIGDWGVVLWVIFLSFWYGTMPAVWLLAGLAIVFILFTIYIAKFHKLCDPEASFLANVSAFAAEELQTDIWGRLQFNFLVIAVFAALFIKAGPDPNFFLHDVMRAVPDYAVEAVIKIALVLYIFLGGYSTRDALDYSEAQARKFKEKLHRLKNAPL